MAGYSLVLSLRRPPIRTDARSPLGATPRTIAAPQPVDARRDARAFVLPTDASHAGTAEPVAVSIHVEAPADFADTAGAALVSADGTREQWVPFAAMTTTPDGRRAVQWKGERQGGTVTIATSREEARHAYLARLDHDASATMRIDCVATVVALRPPEGTAAAGPLRIVRIGHPHWLPLAIATAGLYVGPATTLLLGAGEYELVDPIDGTRRQRFSVPADSAITLDAGFAPPRAAPR